MLKYLIIICVFAWPLSLLAQNKPLSKPNIVILYVDDLGYGDLGCYGATQVHTPNVDKLAKNGLRFTDGHCTAATCTPSRFSLLTGSYAFRNEAAILPGDAPLLIRPGTPTLPAMLQQAGYNTAVIGKWHLGLGNGTINWNEPIKPGPAEVGFNYSFIIPATLDRVPTVYVENGAVVNLDPSDPITVNYNHKIGTDPTGLERPDLLKFKADTQHSNTIVDGISRIGYMSGGQAARWKDREMVDVLTQKTQQFLAQQKDKPFFLYLSYTDIHVPRDPHPRFRGATKMGSRGDAIVQMDWITGEVINMLEKQGLLKNTLVIFTSDNGPVLDDGYDDHAEELAVHHQSGGPYKGGKYSAYEAGTRVPTIVYWPGTVKPGRSRALVNQVDLFASLASLTAQELPASSAPDSFDMLDTWLGRSQRGRPTMLEESFTLALRWGNWKWIAPQEKEAPAWLKDKKIPTGLGKQGQLYNLTKDPAEQHDVSGTYPNQAKKMQDMIGQIKQRGKS
ncbi:MAG: arylsulfatase [Williamsia sp.]|nr:arylsulfatase [Williamsia sp.]